MSVFHGRILYPAERGAVIFDGKTFESNKDGDRLSTQINRVYSLMRDGQWRTLAAIAEIVGGSEAGVSARLRDFRKDRFKTMFKVLCVERNRVSGGLWEYRVVIDTPKESSWITRRREQRNLERGFL